MKKEKTYNLTVFAKFSLGRFPVVEMRLGPKGDDCVNIAGTCIHTPTHTHTHPPNLLVPQQETDTTTKQFWS